MKQAKIIDLLNYRDEYSLHPPTPIKKPLYSEELGDAIQHLIKRLRDQNPIENSRLIR